MPAKAIKQLSAALVVLGMLFWLTAGLLLPVSAAGTGSLSIECCSAEGILLPGMHWKLYHAADRNADGTFTLKSGFEKYSIVMDDSTAAALADTAQTFEVYASLDHSIQPVGEKEAGADGKLVFDDLSAGFYLLCGENYKLGDTYYIPSPVMIELLADGNQVYDMEATPKYVVKDASEGGFEYTVKKVWANDETQTWNRSTYITVDIYCDGERFETVTLSDDNDWTYSWKSNSVHRWNVLETYVPDSYVVVYRANETQFVIVNTFTGDSSITDTNTTVTTDDNDHDTMTTTVTTDSPPVDTQTTSDSNTTDTGTTVTHTTSHRQTTAKTTSKTTTRTTTGTSTGEKLPQTGQLWWPVPALAAAGVILMAIGLRLRPKE